MVILLRFMIYFVFFLLSLALFRYGIIIRLAVTFYFYESDSDRQYIFDQLKISNYDHQYVEEIKLQSNNYFIKFIPIYYIINLYIILFI